MKAEQAEQVAELVHEHGRMVFTTAYRILGNAQDAEDALQEVFLKVLSRWNGRLKANAVRDWGAYLRAAASRSAVDALRRRRSWKEKPGEKMDTLEAPPEQNPRSLAAQREKARLLRRALGALPKREARLFALRYFEDFSYEQIAEQTGMSVSLVGVLLHRARARLREMLEPFMPLNLQQAGLPPVASPREDSHVAE